jgi:hypothetical protein
MQVNAMSNVEFTTIAWVKTLFKNIFAQWNLMMVSRLVGIGRL